MGKIQLHLLTEINKRSGSDINVQFLAVLACFYPNHWDWNTVVVTKIWNNRPLTKDNVKFAQRGKEREGKRQAEHALAETRRVAMDNCDDVLFKRPHTVHKKQHAHNSRLQHARTRKRYVGALQQLQERLETTTSGV